ncbi:MAG: toxin-antitoxin system HicB family antitoxin [Pseudomonadota bacterium]
MKTDYSGKLLLRIDPALHSGLARRALQAGVSINTICSGFISSGLHGKMDEAWWLGDCEKLAALLKKHFGPRLAGVAVFGSQIAGTSTDESDLDVLIVLDAGVPIRRSLYSWWDGAIKWQGRAEASPQFVNLPKDAAHAGSIWFEVALASQIIWERGRALSSFIGQVKKLIEGDAVRRYWKGGQPYWVRRDDEEQGSRS